VTRPAEESDLGTARGTHALGGGNVGCLGLGPAIVLPAPGTCLVSGPYGAAVTGIGAAFLAVAVAPVP
jgi:hypothetical protein